MDVDELTDAGDGARDDLPGPLVLATPGADRPKSPRKGATIEGSLEIDEERRHGEVSAEELDDELARHELR